MASKYYTCNICIANHATVQLEIRDNENTLIDKASGKSGYKGDIQARIQELRKASVKGEITSQEVQELGQVLFSVLFDEALRHNLFKLFDTTQKEDALLRLELDIDDRQFPDLASLPWEFMCVPPDAGFGMVWPGTSPDMTFSRKRAIWKEPEPVQLKIGERLRIVLAVADPRDLGPVPYEKTGETLKELARAERIELLELINPARANDIHAALEKKPHIFHFIGHVRFRNETQRDCEEIALAGFSGLAEWVTVDYFSKLFKPLCPNAVFLQAYESSTLSASEAFAGIASQMVQQNIPVVTAMQHGISDASAKRFIMEFYRRVADNEPVDKAVQEGRCGIALESGRESGDFAMPVLFTRVRDGHLFHRRTDVQNKSGVISALMENARKMEKNASYNEAVKTWKDIRDLDPGHSEIRPALERLKENSKRQEVMKDLLHKLSARRSEIRRPLYVKIARFINRLEKEEIGQEDEILLETIEDFVSGNLSLDELTETWEGDIVRPQAKGPNYDVLAECLNRGEIIPFLGSDILCLSGLTMPCSKELVQKLAENVKYYDFMGTLPMISQYYQQMEQGYNKAMLIRTVKDLMDQEHVSDAPNPLYDLLGDIQAPVILISASYDSLLEDVFQKKGKQFVIISHHIHPTKESDFGKILLKYPGKPEPEAPCSAEAISGLKLLENGCSVIYKVCGCFGLYQAESVDTLDSLMISEDEFFSFSRHLEKLVPDYLIRQFPRRSFLFLGYNLDEWQDRLIANAILEKKRARSERSYVVLEKPTLYEKAFWKSNGVDIVEVGLEQFVSEMSKKINGLKGKADNKMEYKFDVFLCHNSQDKTFVKEIGKKLEEEAALRPWLDEWALRPGLPWQPELEKQIKNIKSVAVFVGKNGMGPWQNLEQAAFIQEFIERQCPVIPVILPECPKVPELPVFLKGMTWVDFRKTDPDPMDQLIWGITGIQTTVK